MTRRVLVDAEALETLLSLRSVPREPAENFHHRELAAWKEAKDNLRAALAATRNTDTVLAEVAAELEQPKWQHAPQMPWSDLTTRRNYIVEAARQIAICAAGDEATIDALAVRALSPEEKGT